MSAWRKATVATVFFALIAALLAQWAEHRFEWGKPDAPKAQCEALDANSLVPNERNAFVAQYQARTTSAIIREPQDTWSNLAFVFVGFLIAAHDRRRFAQLLGLALVTLGIGSGLYHASLRPLWRGMDVATMAWVSFGLACHGYVIVGQRNDNSRSIELRRLWFGAIGATVVMAAAILRTEISLFGVKPFGTLYMTIAGISVALVLAVTGMVRTKRSQPAFRLPLGRLGATLAVVAAAATCQLNDHPGRYFCAPESPIQAHAVWHVLMAVAIAMTYDFFAVLEGGALLWRRAT